MEVSHNGQQIVKWCDASSTFPLVHQVQLGKQRGEQPENHRKESRKPPGRIPEQDQRSPFLETFPVIFSTGCQSHNIGIRMKSHAQFDKTKIP
jgi:hypothetical protein